MSGIEWDAEDKAFQVLAGKLANTDEIIRDLAVNMAEEALNLVREGFGAGQDPYGGTWKEKSTGEACHLAGPTGALRNEWHQSVTGNSFTISNSLIYAGVHQNGAVIVPVNAKCLAWPAGKATVAFMGSSRNKAGSFARSKQVQTYAHAMKVTIPPRPMVPREGDMPSKWEERFRETAEEILDEALGG